MLTVTEVGCANDVCAVDLTEVGTGGITGRASWASRELTTPRLGARTFVTERDCIGTEFDTLGGAFPEDVEFWRSCFNNTFCVSSDLDGVDELGSDGLTV